MVFLSSGYCCFLLWFGLGLSGKKTLSYVAQSGFKVTV